MTKAADRAAQLKARMSKEGEPKTNAESADTLATRAHFVGASVLEELTRGRTVQALPVEQIAPELRDDLRQPRLLPLPEELGAETTENTDNHTMREELLALGRSLRERQIQPIVVYPGTSERYPAAQYLIAAGHRRWTAAVLIGLPTIDAIVITPPTPEELVDIQYSENEDRADFSDMERAWALARMKQVLQDAPWEAVEQRFRLSEGRRKQLMRLMAFSPTQQQQLARLRASETQLRPLHAALRDGTLSTEQADRIVQLLATRAFQQSRAASAEQEQAAPLRPALLDGRSIAQVMSRIQRAANADETTTRPRWIDPLKVNVAQTRRGLQRLLARTHDLDASMALELQQELDLLLESMTQALEVLRQQDKR